MRLLAVRLSEKQSETGKFRTILWKLSQSRGDVPHSRNMKQFLKNGNSMHYQGMKIPLIHLQKVRSHSYMVCILKAVYIVGCGARSALSSVVCVKRFSKLPDHPMISRYLKGIFNRHPPLPKYKQIWDINQVLDYYTNLSVNKEPEFKYIVKNQSCYFLFLVLV